MRVWKWLVTAGLLLPLLTAPGTAAPGGAVMLPPPDGADLFTAVSATVSVLSSGSGMAAGGTCLAVAGRFPGSFGAAWRLPVPGIPAGRAEAEVFVPAAAPADLRVMLFVKDKDGLWFQCSPADPRTKRGAWETVTFATAADAASVQPSGHTAVWNAYYARHVAEAGVAFFSAETWSGTVGVRRMRFSPVPAPAAPETVRIVRTEWVTPAPFQTWSMLELGFDLDGTAGLNPFDPDQVAVDALITGPDGKTMRRPAFYFQPYTRSLDENETEILTPAGRGGWRLRFTPLQPGTYRWKLLVRAKNRPPAETAEHSIQVQTGKPHGFVRVAAADGNFFETADGRWFNPIGEHIHSPFDRRSSALLNAPLPPPSGTFIYDRYFDKLSRNGGNSVIVWMSSWWLAVEWTPAWKGFFGLTDYHLANAWRLDYLLDQAAKQDLYILLMLDNHGKFSLCVDPEWALNPMNRSLGGPCETPEDFFSSDEAFTVYQKRLRYLAARWGHHPNLMGWLLISEMDLCGTTRKFRWHPSTVELCRKAALYLNEVNGMHRPVTVQYAGNWKNVDPALASLKEIDFLVSNAYKDRGSIIPLLMSGYNILSSYKKPVFVAEFGGSWRGTEPEQMRADFHAGLWTTAMSPVGGAPFFWWYEFVDKFNLYSEFKSLDGFLEGQDPRGRDWIYGDWTVFDQGTRSDKIGGLMMRAPDRGRAWVYDRTAAASLEKAEADPAHTGVSMTLVGMTPGAYQVEYWDTFAGRVVGTDRVTADAEGSLKLDFPAFTTDMAARFRKLP